MDKIKRERAAWRFDPRILERLRKFVSSRDRMTTQTSVIEEAVSEYLDRHEGSKHAEGRR